MIREKDGSIGSDHSVMQVRMKAGKVTQEELREPKWTQKEVDWNTL